MTFEATRWTTLEEALWERIEQAASKAGVEDLQVVELAWAWVLSLHTGESEVAYALRAPGGRSLRRAQLDGAVPALEAARQLGALPLVPGADAAEAELIEGEDAPEAGAPISVAVARRGRTLAIRVVRASGRFDPWTADRLVEHLRRALAGIAAAPGTPLHALPLLTPEDRATLEQWGSGPRSGALDRCVHQLFSAQAARAPEAPAIRHAGGVVSYGELEAEAERIARRLRAMGVGPDVVVALCAERAPRAVAALLGILKAGGAYLPLDPAYPLDRLAFMLQDTGARVLVADQRFCAALPPHPRTLVLDAEPGPLPEGAHPTGGAGPGNLAYVCYTSGSTGVPKGAAVPHRAVTRLVMGLPFLGLGPDTVLLHAAPLAFDASTLELWGALASGGCVALHDEAVPTARGLRRSVARYGVNTMWLTASLFNAVVDESPESLAGVRWLLTGGEALSVDHVRRAQAALPGTTVVNGYGPTEATTFTTCHPIPLVQAGARSIPIGAPIGDTRVWVLDERREPVPLGAVGELWVGGPGVALGYVGRPELTAERFRLEAPDERLYRTGDLVRWAEGGVLDFVGRADGQVKIRGFRIELGEVEAGLRQLPTVRSAAVIARQEAPGAAKRLVAYLVPADPAVRPGAGVLREAMRERLPEHMVPAAFVWLDALPVNANGKLDRAALPAPAADRGDLGQDFVAPGSPTERRIAAIWEGLLGRAPIGAHDGFFELGGDSLLAVRSAARVRDELGVDVPVVELFEHTTVAKLARRVEEGRAGPARSAVAPVPRAAGNARPAIAVVGMAGRFPGAPSVEVFWQNLCAGLEGITFFSDAELDPSIPAALRADPAYVKARGVVEGCDLFDAAFFGISPKEAELMDPQQRLLLEVSWEALERAGHVPDRFRGAIGVWAGKYFDFYWDENVRTRPDLIEQLGDLNARTGNDKHFVATRLAHKLNLTGPAISVHSACSTSLVAICQAMQSLRTGECDLALAGGASITVPVRSGYLYQEGSMLSPDGHCRPFDARASGTTFSDGVAMVVLRRLDEALADGDTVYAVIRGGALNNDGAHRASYTAPSVEGQAAVITRALADAGVPARSISYVETHGTATPLGDPIEVEALTRAFRASTPDRGFCTIGSVKSNVGHLVIAAGATGLIKTSLALHHRTLPGTAHFERPNPRIDFASSPFRVQGALTPWGPGDGPRRAGVSSFGVGGTNAHLILEEAPPSAPSGPSRPKQLLRLSARTPAALDAATAALREHLRASGGLPLADVAFTLAEGRQDLACRRVLVCDEGDVLTGLDLAARRLLTGKVASGAPQVVFMFPGQGSQHVDMARNLYRGEPVFRAAVDACADAVRDLLERDLREVIWPAGDPGAAAEVLRQTAYTQPALFTISYALAKLWQSWGVEPAAMVGHSVGEFVCAVLAGVLPAESAVRLVAARGRLVQSQPAGSMLSVTAGADEVTARLRDRPSLAVATDNAPQACVVAGPTPDIGRLQQELEAAGLGCRLLVTSHAFHSPMMDPAVAPFEAEVRKVALAAPRIPFVSTVTGDWITPEQATDPGYWGRHLRATVRFGAAVRTLLAEPGRVLLEVGPRGTLATLARRQVKDPTRTPVIASLGDAVEGHADLVALLQAAGQLWLAGGPAPAALFAGEQRRRVVLPTYPFERKRFWVAPAQAPAATASAPVEGAALPSPAPAAAPAAPPSHTPPNVELQVTTTNPSSAHRLASLRELFEEVTGLDLADADPGATFVDLGLDSLFLTQAALQVQRRFGVKVTFRQLMESLNTLGALAEHLDAQLPPEPVAAPVPEVPAAAPVAAAAPLVPALAAAALAPVALGAPAVVPGVVQQVIDQQLRLMAQQLALLGVAPAGTAAPAQAAPAHVVNLGAVPPAPSPAPRNVAVAAPAPAPAPVARAAAADGEEGGVHKYDVKKAFGAIARIHTKAETDMTPRQRARFEALVRRYCDRTKTSKAYTQANRHVLADPRVVTGFKPLLKEVTYQVVVERSKGARLWDLDGNEYVDALCGFGSCFFGWQPDFVTEAVKRQLDTGHEIGPMTPLAAEVAKLVCELTGFDRAGFCNTGSEAVMGCMRVARTVTGRSTIVTFTGAYHGIFDEVIVRGTKKLKAIPAAPGIMPNTSQNVLVLDYGTPESLEIIRSRASELAAVLVEPVQSRRPDFQPGEFLKEVRKITQEAGAALIFDEVVNGFRTGPGGAQEHFGVQADLASYGKVVGGGFPIGVIAGKKAWADALDGGSWQFGDDSVPTVGVTYFAGTFCRHPLALAAARAVLLHLKERGPALQQEMTARTAAMVAELNGFFEEVKVPIKVKTFSSLWKTFFTEELPFSELLFVMLRDRGIHIMDGFPCFLTTAHTQADVDKIVRAFKESVAEMQEAGFLPAPPPATRVEDASQPPVPGARLGRDPGGKPTWYVPNPAQPGKYVPYEAK